MPSLRRDNVRHATLLFCAEGVTVRAIGVEKWCVSVMTRFTNILCVTSGVIFYSLAAVAYPVLIGVLHVVRRDSSGWQCIFIATCVVVIAAMAIGLVILYLYSRSFKATQETCTNHNTNEYEKYRSNEDELEKVRRYIEDKFGGRGRNIVIDYRFSNGCYADMVVLSGNGQYPMMCFEVTHTEDTKTWDARLIDIMRAYKKQLDVFVIQKTKDGFYQLHKSRGIGNYHSIGTISRLDYEAAEKRIEVLSKAAKKWKMLYPIIFMAFSATPLVEAMIVLAVADGGSGKISMWVPVSFWIVAMLAIMGIGIKGYVPSFDDLA